MADKEALASEGELEELEQQFDEVLAGLTGDPTLEAFRAQYEQLLTALRRSHEGERRLVKKLRETNAEIVQNAARVQQALKLSEEDAATIDELKRQGERAWAMVEAANAREEQATAAIERLQAEIGQLSAVVQRHANLLGGDMTIEELISTRDSLTIQLRDATQNQSYEKERASGLAAELESRNEKFKEKKAQVKSLERMVAQKAAEETKEIKKRLGAEAEVKALKEQLGEQMNLVSKERRAVAEIEEARSRLHHRFDKSVEENQRLSGEYSALQSMRVQLETEQKMLRDRIAQMVEVRGKLDGELKAVRADLSAEKTRASKLASRLELEEKDKAEIMKQLKAAQDLAAGVRAEKSATEKELTKEMMRTKNAQDAGARLDREKTAAEKKAAMEQSKVKEARDLASTLKGGNVVLENEARKLHVELQKSEAEVTHAEREKVRLRQEVEALEKRAEALEEELRLRDVQINELDKRELELQSRIKQGTQSYEAMRAERNAISKQLNEAQDEINETKRKSKVQGNQIEQLKEDIQNKDKGLVAEQFESASLAKKLEVRNHEVEQLRRLLEDASTNVQSAEQEIRDLSKALRRLDADALAQKRAFDQVVCERDINQSQLLRRNDEIALLYEKVAVMTTMLSTGEVAYRQRLEDIKLLTLKAADLTRSLNIATDDTKAGNKDAMKAENVRLQKELLAEQSRVKGLSEELSNPLNVHRWRKLEGSDPASFDLVQKVQTLQRRLIAKTEAVVEREMRLLEKDKEVAALREQLNNVPGPEVAEQLAAVRLALNDRTRELKAVASEVNMAQAQVAEYKFDADRTQRELQEAKKELFELSRRSGAGAGAASATRASGGTNRPSSEGGSGAEGTGGTGGARAAGSGVAADAAQFKESMRKKQLALQESNSSRRVMVGGGFNIHSA